MIKRKFGMACLNITQGRYGGYSHKNLNAYDLAGMDSDIDRFKTFNDLEVIGIHRFNYSTKSGFGNTVHFFDSQNNVTIAMTHANSIPRNVTVGNVLRSGETIYFEGKTGNATGNHIHLELGWGKQSCKYKKNGTWQLKDLINIEDYFYIDDSYTWIKDDNGYKFSFNAETEGGGTNVDNQQSVVTDTWLVCPNGQNIRTGICGKAVAIYAPKGSEVPIVGMIDGFQKDKYQWCEVEFKGVRGYAQIDTKFNWIKRR